MDGDFEINGREFHYSIESIETSDGETYTDGEVQQYIGDVELERIVYSLQPSDGTGEEVYRTLYGPFESIDDIEVAIMDESDYYESVA